MQQADVNEADERRFASGHKSTRYKWKETNIKLEKKKLLIKKVVLIDICD